MNEVPTIYSKEKTSCLRISLRDCSLLGNSPRNLFGSNGLYTPVNKTNMAWVPQTMGEQVWVYFEFASVGEKDKWETSLSDKHKLFLDEILFKWLPDFGWHKRDANGFY